MLINRSYFTGELGITNTNTLPIQQRLDYFIEKYEPEIMKGVLGYELYKAFNAGVLIDSVDQKWTDLIVGVEYTGRDSRLYKWEGLITIDAGIANVLYDVSPYYIVVGRGQSGDPVSGSSSVTIPTQIQGKAFSFVQRAFGELTSDEYSITGTTLTLLNGVKFSSGDKYFYKLASIPFATVTTTGNRSLIANYVYYMYMRDQATQSSAMGEVSPKSENSDRVSPAQKMVNAWNGMSEQIQRMWHFLDSNRTTYSEWYWCAKRWSDYRTINTMGI